MSKEWKAARLLALRRDNWTCVLCEVKCLGKARGRPSPQVDHIEPITERPDLKLTLSNLRTLCPSCHSRHTILGTIGKTRPEIGPDGYPLEPIQAPLREVEGDRPRAGRGVRVGRGER